MVKLRTLISRYYIYALRPKGIDVVSGNQRSQFHHVIDLFPTILDVTGIEAPDTVNGIQQMPVHGISMRYCFSDKEAEDRRKTQYFEILGNRGIYHDGWMAIHPS